MKHTHFEIRNFKGIQELRIDFDAAPDSRVITLVGLNESGKTTVLEAMNYYKHKPASLEPLKIAGYEVGDIHDLIPIARRSNFTDTISISAGYVLTPAERGELEKFINNDLKLVLERPIEEFKLTLEHTFVDSKHTDSHSFYDGIPGARRRTGSRFSPIVNFEQEWLQIDNWLRDRLPAIVYFPNFLFDFPDKIYLDDAPSDPELHEFYKRLIQKILTSLGKGLLIKKHILDRAKSTDKNDQRNLLSTLSEMGGHVTKTVFDAWDAVFRRKHAAKEIRFSVDKDEQGLVFIQFQIKDGTDIFSIHERSLGFRWFFTFLLLTQYLARSGKDAEGQLFLFDEPASNLHSSAQQQLLQSFDRFHPESKILYTTHSHHLINPFWLESAYVVKNEGLDYADPSDAYSARESKIAIDRYRNFAARHPDQTTYYQPILDVLEYRPSNLELARDAIFFEGKNDSYTLALAATQLRKPIRDACFVPGTGSGNLEPLIRLYLGWGRRFVVLLDDDAAGRREKTRYLKLLGAAVADRLFTLGDIDVSLKGCRLEDVVPKAERDAIQLSHYPGGKTSKDLYNRCLQEALQKGDNAAFAPATAAKFGTLIDGVLEKLRV